VNLPNPEPLPDCEHRDDSINRCMAGTLEVGETINAMGMYGRLAVSGCNWCPALLHTEHCPEGWR